MLHEATERIMDEVTRLLEEIRGEQAPAVRFDPRTAGVREIGNPHEQKSAGTGDVHEQGGSVRSRVVGYRVLAWCSPTPATT